MRDAGYNFNPTADSLHLLLQLREQVRYRAVHLHLRLGRYKLRDLNSLDLLASSAPNADLRHARAIRERLQKQQRRKTPRLHYRPIRAIKNPAVLQILLHFAVRYHCLLRYQRFFDTRP